MHLTECGIYFGGVDESVDGAAFLDLSEDDVKMMVKPLGHVKRVLRLLSNIKTKVMMQFSIYNWWCLYYRVITGSCVSK